MYKALLSYFPFFFDYTEEYNYSDLYSRLFALYPNLVEIKAQYITKHALIVFSSTPHPDLKIIDMLISEIENDDFINMLTLCPNIVSLSLSGNDWEKTDEIVKAITDLCPHLTKLELTDAGSITDTSLSYISSLMHLVELNISTLSSFISEQPTISSIGLQSMIQACCKLEVLKCKVYEGSVDEFFITIGIYCQRLRVFSCDMLDGFNDGPSHAAVVALIRGCSQLEEVDIEDYCPNDAVLQALSEACPHLRRMYCFSYDPDVFTDLGLIALSRGCPNLTELSLRNAPSVTDDAILSFAEHCHELEMINISHNHHITSITLCSLLKSNPRITAVELTDCQLVDDDVILTLTQYRPKLKFLGVIDCARLTEGPLTSLVLRCRFLEDVSITDSTAITDTLVDLLARYSKRLQTIYLCRCPHITGDSVASLLEEGRYLTYIYIDNCALQASDDLCRYYKYAPIDRPPSRLNIVSRLLSYIRLCMGSRVEEGEVIVPKPYVSLSRVHRRTPWELPGAH